MELVKSEKIAQYFSQINDEVKRCYDITTTARSLGFDPEKSVPIPLANNMAERVVGLISVVAPQLAESNLTIRITELEKEYGQLDWRVGLKIAEEVAKETFCSFTDKQEAIEIGIRVGFAYLTLGIVSAPLEGFIGIKVKKRQDGKEYLAIQYAGPIRGAGGTAASTSVILSDYVRVKMGYAPYDPTEKEVNRYVTEINDYHERVTNLQYRPSDEELKFMISHLPVEVDGDPTEKMEVSNHKDLPRIETNLIRGGVALVVAEGLCQKSPKLWKRLSKWGEDFDLEWNWLKEFIDLKEKIHAKTGPAKSKDAEEVKKVKPNNTFIMDLVAGRPILTHPMGEGGLRLRYGRTRCSGFSSCAMHPATLQVLEKYIAIGTQLKVERPGKAATVTVCDSINGPIVRLQDGSVMEFETTQQARDHVKEIDEVLFLGDILFNYGDFSENGHPLVPVGYCPEWWAREVERAINDKYGTQDLQSASKDCGVSVEEIEEILLHPTVTKVSWDTAKKISKTFGVPLHPYYIYFWDLVSGEEVYHFREWLRQAKIKTDEGKVVKVILPYYSDVELHTTGKKILETMGVPHSIISKENVVFEKKDARVLVASFAIKSQKDASVNPLAFDEVKGKKGIDVINSLSSYLIRAKAGTFVGARMGRPEKAKMRKMTGSPQVMFPVGDEGDRLRSFQSALKAGKVVSVFPFRFCDACNTSSIYSRCERCDGETGLKYYCRFCGDLSTEQCRHGKGNPYKVMEIDINHFFESARTLVGETVVPDLIKGIRGTSNKNHVVEHLSKGILRAKHSIYVNKDGTTRYDCTEMPITHFKPKEIKTSVEKLRELGYTHDIYGKELVDKEQVCEIKPQDIILPGFDSLEDSAAKVLTNVANFVDDLLVKLYGSEPYYNITKEEDLAGHLVVGLAPHISAGLIGRIIGFSETQGLLTHPMYHAGLRRDCDGDEACVMLLLDSLLNFSRQYLPERRGAKTMDAPLVLTSTINPAEVDDQVHGMDVEWQYPLEFYEAAQEMKKPWEVVYGADKKKIEQLGDRIGTEGQYEKMGFTHPITNFNKGVLCSAYKTQPSMQEKLFGQMEIAKKVRAVNMDDVARLVIQKHFLKDIKGNLRKYSMQKFRCGKCNEKYRRPPLAGKCLNCGSKLIFTISHGSVIKYLIPSLALAEKYNFSPYLKQTLNILKDDVDNIFGREKDKQVGLGSFMG